jgi:hypothetical protein
MHRRNAMPDPKVELRLRGSTNLAGDFKGKGELRIQISDAAKARLLVDYRRPDRITVSVDSTAGIRLSADDTLTLAGGLTRDVVNNTFGGKIRAELKISRDLKAELEQSFGATGPTTSFELSLRL